MCHQVALHKIYLFGWLIIIILYLMYIVLVNYLSATCGGKGYILLYTLYNTPFFFIDRSSILLKFLLFLYKIVYSLILIHFILYNSQIYTESNLYVCRYENGIIIFYRMVFFLLCRLFCILMTW